MCDQMRTGMDQRELELYLHIPFCVRKCLYCDFLSAPAGQEKQRAYLEALKREIRMFPDKNNYFISTVFFGGGTPSVLPAEWIEELMGTLRSEFQFATEAPEITIECNPGTADEEKLRAYRAAGINRISLGLQSAHNRELALLGRIHTWEEFLRTYEAARAAGFHNINVDLMSALPGQTVKSWEETLNRVLKLAPEHISAYSLIIEPGTPFYEKYAEDVKLRDLGEQPRRLPSEDEERQMYYMTDDILGAAGVQRYEISNYALPGFGCRHNIGYWSGTEYAGFGLGASSLLCRRSIIPRHGEKTIAQETGQYIRYRNPEDMSAYLTGDFSGREQQALSLENRMEEFMFLGLRMIRGVREREFAARFGKTVDEVYGAVLERLASMGLLQRTEGRIALTRRGIDVSNHVLAEFLL